MEWLWLFEAAPFKPRIEAGDWPEWLVSLTTISNVIIVTNCYIIAGMLYLFYKKKSRQFTTSRVLLSFILFISFFGLGHILDIVVFYWPVYRLWVLVDLITAGLMTWTTVLLPRIIITWLKMRPVEELERANKQLEEEINSRKEMEANVKDANHELANQVQVLQNQLQIQGWIAAKQVDLDAMKKIVTDLRKEYAGPDKTTP